MKKQFIVAVSVALAGCAAGTPTQHQVELASSGRKVDFVNQRVDNKDCPTGVVHYVFDEQGVVIGSATWQGNAFYCHVIDQLGGVAQGVGLGVGLSNLRPARETTNVSNEQAQDQDQGQIQAQHATGGKATAVAGASASASAAAVNHNEQVVKPAPAPKHWKPAPKKPAPKHKSY